MRITNNMITSNTKYNINANKVLVDKFNTQMTTQKKINKASDDPVIAIRSLRMQTNLSHLTQYLDNNIEDVQAWIDVTHTAMNNMKEVLDRIRTLCVDGSTDSKESLDRETILKELKAMQDQVYTEANADYAGRTIFTGYRTNCQFTFMDDEQNTTYEITQKFTYEDLMDKRYYSGEAEVPVDANTPSTTEIERATYSRLRLAYNQIGALTDSGYNASPEITIGGTAQRVTEYATQQDWIDANIAAGKGELEIGDNDVIFIRDTGEVIFGKDIAHDIAQNKKEVEVHYNKKGFAEGEPRPEYFFDCTMQTQDMKDKVVYTKQEQKIHYTISNGITIPANTEASDILSPDIGRDITELIDIVSAAVNADAKVAKIEQMMGRDQYSDEDSQKVLQGYLDAAKKEAAYANDNLQKTFSQYITNFDNYFEDVNIGITNLGSLENRLDMTKTRVENQKETVELLKAGNEDRDISDIIIDYYASYNAYTASLTAASKVGQQTLLNYL